MMWLITTLPIHLRTCKMVSRSTVAMLTYFSATGAYMVDNLFSIAGRFGRTAPIVMPIAATLAFARWVYDVYAQT